MTDLDDYRKRLARLNDEVRRHAGIDCANLARTNPHKVVITSGVMRRLESEVPDLLEKIRSFDDFSEKNNPWNERNFGGVEQNETKVFWEFDYYDRDELGGSHDPSDPEKTLRILTIFLPEEY